MLRLYHQPLCPFSRKIRLVLREKNLAAELVEVEPWQRDPDFLRLNPAAEVPVLVDDELVVADSSAIADYLNETHGEPELIGRDPAQRNEVRRLVGLVRRQVPPRRHRPALGREAAAALEAERHAELRGAARRGRQYPRSSGLYRLSLRGPPLARRRRSEPRRPRRRGPSLRPGLSGRRALGGLGRAPGTGTPRSSPGRPSGRS